MVAASLLSTLLFALAVVAQPAKPTTSQVKLGFSKRIISTGTGPINLVEQDRLRANYLKAGNPQALQGRSAVLSSPADNRAVSYIATVGVGSPPTNCK
jgi:cathepsin E